MHIINNTHTICAEWRRDSEGSVRRRLYRKWCWDGRGVLLYFNLTKTLHVTHTELHVCRFVLGKMTPQVLRLPHEPLVRINAHTFPFPWVVAALTLPLIIGGAVQIMEKTVAKVTKTNETAGMFYRKQWLGDREWEGLQGHMKSTPIINEV